MHGKGTFSVNAFNLIYSGPTRGYMRDSTKTIENMDRVS